MPSGPKKRAKAKKTRQQHLGLHDDPDTQSRSSDDKETDTVDSVDDQEEDLALKSPLGKSAYARTADEDYKSQTEKWVRVSNFEVGLPTPRSEGSTTDYDHLIEDENNGTRSPDWETVEGESAVGLDDSLPDREKGDGVLTISHAVKPEELEAVLQSAEKDYFSPKRVEEPSKDGFDDTSAGGSLAVERGTDVPDYSVGSGTVPYGSSLHDSSEDQADYNTQNVLDVTETDSKLAVGALTQTDDDFAQTAEESSVQQGSDSHPQVDHTDRSQTDQPLSGIVGSDQQVEDGGASQTFGSVVKAEPVEKIDGTGDQDSSSARQVEDGGASQMYASVVKAEPVETIEGTADQDSSIAGQDESFPGDTDALPVSVEDDIEAYQQDDTEEKRKELSEVGAEHVEIHSESVEEKAVGKSEDRHLHDLDVSATDSKLAAGAFTQTDDSAETAEETSVVQGSDEQESFPGDTDALPVLMEDDTEAYQLDDTEEKRKELSQVGDEHVETHSESVEEKAVGKSEDRHLHDLDVTATDSKLAAGAFTQTERAEESSVVEGSDEQDFHAQVDHTDRSQTDQPLSGTVGSDQQVEDGGASQTYASVVKAEPVETIEGAGEQDSSIAGQVEDGGASQTYARVAKAEPVETIEGTADQDSSIAGKDESFPGVTDTLPVSVEDDTEAEQKDDTEEKQKVLAQVGDEHFEIHSESVDEEAVAKSEDRHLHEGAESHEVTEGDVPQTADVADPLKENKLPPSSPHEKLIGIPDNHAEPETPRSESLAVSSSETGSADLSAGTSRTADGKQIEEQGPGEVTALETSMELPNVEAVNILSIHLESSFEPQEERKDVVVELKELSQSSSSGNVHSLTDDHTESPPAEVAGRANGHSVDLPSVAPSAAEKTLPTLFPEGTAPVLTVSKLEMLQAADGTSLGAVASVHPVAVSDLRPNERVLVAEQAKDVRDRNSSGCCGVLYWVFGQTD